MVAECPPLVGVYCDLGQSAGTGHAVRCTALACALARQGTAPVLVCDVDRVPWIGQQAEALGLDVQPAASFDELFSGAARWSGVVVDSYLARPEQWRRVSELGVPVLAVDDLANRPLPVNLVVNQNLAAVDYDYTVHTAARVLRGPEFALVRDAFVRARPQVPHDRLAHEGARRVLVVLGGTDPAGASVVLAERLLDGPAPVHVRVLTGDEYARSRIEALPVRLGWRVEARPSTPNIEQDMAWADLAVSAAGSTVWELCCLGVPMALGTVADNQLDNYRHLLDRGIAIGLGSWTDRVPETLPLDRMLNPARLRTLAERAWRTVDGRGADRVAEAFSALLAFR